MQIARGSSVQTRKVRRMIDATKTQRCVILVMSCGHNQRVSELAMQMHIAPPEVGKDWACHACPDAPPAPVVEDPLDAFRTASFGEVD